MAERVKSGAHTYGSKFLNFVGVLSGIACVGFSVVAFRSGPTAFVGVALASATVCVWSILARSQNLILCESLPGGSLLAHQHQIGSSFNFHIDIDAFQSSSQKYAPFIQSVLGVLINVVGSSVGLAVCNRDGNCGALVEVIKVMEFVLLLVVCAIFVFQTIRLVLVDASDVGDTLMAVVEPFKFMAVASSLQLLGFSHGASSQFVSAMTDRRTLESALMLLTTCVFALCGCLGLLARMQPFATGIHDTATLLLFVQFAYNLSTMHHFFHEAVVPDGWRLLSLQMNVLWPTTIHSRFSILYGELVGNYGKVGTFLLCFGLTPHEVQKVLKRQDRHA